MTYSEGIRALEDENCELKTENERLRGEVEELREREADLLVQRDDLQRELRRARLTGDDRE